MACDDEAEWLATAMTDDSTVAELLLRIHSAGAPPHAAAAAARALKLDWTVRQRRSSNSKPAPKEPGRKKRGGEPARASPTTPLSWSGATSTSGGGGGGGGGDEECSGVPVVKSPEKARSKTTNGSTTTSAATPSKRPRKKKTLAELREEENKLLKERRRLRWGLANLRRVVEKQRLANESLKKMKLDTQCKREAETTPEEQPLNVSSCTPCSSASKTCKVETCDRLFELPDLNLPVEGASLTLATTTTWRFSGAALGLIDLRLLRRLLLRQANSLPSKSSEKVRPVQARARGELIWRVLREIHSSHSRRSSAIEKPQGCLLLHPPSHYARPCSVLSLANLELRAQSSQSGIVGSTWLKVIALA
ncbi:hypothetical protein NL676_006912 [Syzygium grande]|nr:hypothetical protein NL676_006912 [Syzygium grande]